MATKDRAVDRGRRDADRQLRLVAGELREARLAAGLSQCHVGRAVGISHAGVSSLPPLLSWRTETPIPIVGDLRAWDASIDGPGWTVFVDAETRIRDVQALERRTALKRRDTATDRVILLIADTRSNRAILASLAVSLIEGALPGRPILSALEAGRDPEAVALSCCRRLVVQAMNTCDEAVLAWSYFCSAGGPIVASCSAHEPACRY